MMTTINNDVLSTPCCDVWIKVMGRFDWMHFEENSDILTMPHIKSGEQRFFVNHCPSCGADVRNYMAHINKVDESRSLTGDLL
jgi:hypothetical protein